MYILPALEADTDLSRCICAILRALNIDNRDAILVLPDEDAQTALERLRHKSAWNRKALPAICGTN